MRGSVFTLRHHHLGPLSAPPAEEDSMRPGRRRMRERIEGVRAWPIWEHPPWLRAYIVAVVAVNLLAVALAIRVGGLGTGRSLVLLGVLLACEAATVEFTKRAGEITGI